MKIVPLWLVALFLFGLANATPDVPNAIIAFDHDPYVGSNITCNPAYLPYECNPAHHDWLNALGIDITGTPAGFLWTTRIWSAGLHGTTGNVIGYAAPNHLYAGGLDGTETLTIHFLNDTVNSATLELVAVPTSYSGVANVEAAVRAQAFGTDGALLNEAALTWTPVLYQPPVPKAINNPGYVRLTSESDIARITFWAEVAPYDGLYLESICTVGLRSEVDVCPALVVHPERNLFKLT